MKDNRDLILAALTRRVTALEAGLALVAHRCEKDLAELRGRFEALLDRVQTPITPAALPLVQVNKEGKCLQ